MFTRCNRFLKSLISILFIFVSKKIFFVRFEDYEVMKGAPVPSQPGLERATT